MKRIALAAAISLATLTVAALLWRFRDAAILFALSVVAGRRGPTRDRRARAPPRALAGASRSSTSLGLALFGIFVYLVSRGVLRELDDAADRLSAAYDRLRARPAASRGFLTAAARPAAARRRAVSRHRRRAPHPAARPGARRSRATPSTSPTQIIVVVALSAYWSASREAFERLWLSLVPAPQRPRARDVWRAVERAVGSHVRGELAASVLSALVLAVMFRLARLPLPMLPALAAGRAAPGPVLRRAAGGRRRVPGRQHRGPAGGRAAAAASRCWSSSRSTGSSPAGCSPRAVPARR